MVEDLSQNSGHGSFYVLSCFPWSLSGRLSINFWNRNKFSTSNLWREDFLYCTALCFEEAQLVVVPASFLNRFSGTHSCLQHAFSQNVAGVLATVCVKSEAAENLTRTPR